MKISTRYSGLSGLYACVYPARGLRQYLEIVENHIPEVQIQDELHCTLMYSRNAQPSPLIAAQLVNTGPSSFYAIPKCFDYWDGHDNEGYLVLRVESEALNKRHMEWRRAGARHSFPDYESHITMCTGHKVSKELLASMNESLDNSFGGITFVGEHIEDIKS
jgi:hypothetical protein